MSEKKLCEKKFDTLVVSAGGVKGFSLLGGVQALIDNDEIKFVDKFIGTSVGSIICYLMIIGYNPVELLGIINSNKWLEKMNNFDIVSVFNNNGAISFSHIAEAIEKLTLSKVGRFFTLGKLREVFNKTLICVTYNMTTCNTEYLGPDNYPDLPCVTALRMSCNIPIIFDRFQYLDCYYIDGACTQSFPIQKAQEIGEKIIGLYIMSKENSVKDEPEQGILNYFYKLLQIPMLQNLQNILEKVDKEKTTIIPLENESLIQGSVKFDIDHQYRMNMFFSGYSIVNNFLTKT